MSPLESVLAKIVAARRQSVDRADDTIDRKHIEPSTDRESLSEVLKKFGIGLIAEVKMSSPSRGDFSSELSVADIVETYTAAGASAISVLTEPDYFNGSWRNLRLARESTDIPILCKDFIIDERQLYAAQANGADAVLLIAAVLDDAQMSKMVDLAHDLGLEVLTEAINRTELDRILASKTDVVGINNRNLHTLKIDLQVGYDLLEGLPHDRPVVIESGIFARRDVAQFKKRGADGILVGTALMESGDMAAKISELIEK